MTVELDTNYIVALAAAFGVWLLFTVRSNATAARAYGKLMETVIKFNGEIQDMAKQRADGEKERATLRAELDAVTVEIKTVRDDCVMREKTMSAKVIAIEARAEKREADMNAEIQCLQSKIEELETEIERLQHALEVERDLRRADLKAFQSQINEKNAQIAELKKERDQLRARVDKLETAMNGKLDKPSTDDVTIAAAQAVAHGENTHNKEEKETDGTE